MVEKLAKATFENEMCEKCKHLPLCFGPCSQKVMETPAEQFKNICPLTTTEIQPETVIVDYFKKKEGLIKIS